MGWDPFRGSGQGHAVERELHRQMSGEIIPVEPSKGKVPEAL